MLYKIIPFQAKDSSKELTGFDPIFAERQKQVQQEISYQSALDISLEILGETMVLLEERESLQPLFAAISADVNISNMDKDIIREKTVANKYDAKAIANVITKYTEALDLQNSAVDQKMFFEIIFHVFTTGKIAENNAESQAIMKHIITATLEKNKNMSEVLTRGFLSYVADNQELLNEQTAVILKDIITTMALPLRKIISEQQNPSPPVSPVSFRDNSLLKVGNQEDVAPGYYSKVATPIAIPFAKEIQIIKDKYHVTIKRADEIELVEIGLNKKNVRSFYNSSSTQEFETCDFDLSLSATQAAQEIVQVVTQWTKQVEKEKLRGMKEVLAMVRTAFYRQQ